MKLKLIQAGVGGMGGHWWKNAVRQSQDFELVAIVDVNDAPMEECGNALNIPPERRFKSLADAIKAVQADAVLTVTPPPVHLQHARLAFDAGLHLLTEKPMGATLDEAKEMVRLAKAANRQLSVTQNYRYSPQMATMSRLTRQSPLGTLGHGKIDFFIPGDFRGSFRETMEYPLLVDMSIHHMDLIRHITGKNIRRVTAHTFHPHWSWYQHHPGLHMLLELDDHIPFTYTGDWSARGHCTTWDGAWRLQFDNGCLELDYAGKLSQTTSTFWGNEAKTESIDFDQPALTQQAALLSEFATAIRTGKPTPTSGEDNLWSFATVCAGVLSAQQKRTIDVGELLI